MRGKNIGSHTQNIKKEKKIKNDGELRDTKDNKKNRVDKESSGHEERPSLK